MAGHTKLRSQHCHFVDIKNTMCSIHIYMLLLGQSSDSLCIQVSFPGMIWLCPFLDLGEVGRWWISTHNKYVMCLICSFFVLENIKIQNYERQIFWNLDGVYIFQLPPVRDWAISWQQPVFKTWSRLLILCWWFSFATDVQHGYYQMLDVALSE